MTSRTHAPHPTTPLPTTSKFSTTKFTGMASEAGEPLYSLA